ncbi:MAG TPA: SAP domain-containing protein [Dehalococcoidales bacterium]|nr:SAP domain-containing protein [Dehalococcoidales bacterium]
MPLEVKTPLHGKLTLSDKTLGAMVEVIDESEKYGVEHGVTFCQRDDTIDPDSTCKGGQCAVGVPHCPPGTKKVGDFHTHPNTMNQKGYAIPSPGDHLHSLLAGDKLNCIWGQQDGKVACESPVRETGDQEKKSLIERFDELRSAMKRVATSTPIGPEDRADLTELAEDLSGHYSRVAVTDRAGLVEAKGKVVEEEAVVSLRDRVIEYDRTYSLSELKDRAKQAGLSTSGDKKELCRKLIGAGAI